MKAIVCGLAIIFLISARTYAVSSQGQATQEVLKAISITNISDLNFGVGTPGDPALTVQPGNFDNAMNASFEVGGEPNSNYTIILPADGVVEMVNGNGPSANDRIPVNLFTSNPTGVGQLSPSGKQTILVGATRNALKPNQRSGSYRGSFTITVSY